MRVVRGREILRTLGEPLDDLLAETQTPIMARRVWLETWNDCYRDHEPWVVYVQARDRIRAAALLASKRRHGVLEVVRMGHGATAHARLPAADPEAAGLLAEGLVAELHAIRGPWSLFLGVLPPDDPVAQQIVASLPTANIVSTDGGPTVPLDRGRSVEDYVPRKVRSNIRTRTNRMRREGHAPVFFATRDGDAIAGLLPEADRIRRARDVALGRRCKLDDPRYRRLRALMLSKLAETGEVEVIGLRIGDELVAYQIGLIDGDAYRQWEHRFDPAWSRFGPGTMVNSEAIRSVVEDLRFGEFDFMRGMHPHKLEFTDHVRPAVDLVAWSSSLPRGLAAAEDGLKRMVRAVRHPRGRGARHEAAAGSQPPQQPSGGS